MESVFGVFPLRIASFPFAKWPILFHVFFTQVKQYRTLYVQDINDNSPLFVKEIYQANVPEVGLLSLLGIRH